jgi:hypothetical protein
VSVLVSASGTLTVKDANDSGSDNRPISLGASQAPADRYYQAHAQATVALATSGAVGAAFEPLAALAALTQVELLQLRSSQEIAVRMYAEPAEAQAVAGVFPTAFAGGETLVTTMDGVTVTTTFDVADQTALQCAARINAAFALAGFATPRCDVVGGQLRLTGVSTKQGVGALSFTTTAGSTRLGLAAATSPTITTAQGQDVRLCGFGMWEFPTTGAKLLAAVELSGSATVDVLAAGRSN